MVEETRRNCPNCLAAQFDLGRLQDVGSAPMLREAWPKEEVPEAFDVILVSDVRSLVGSDPSAVRWPMTWGDVLRFNSVNQLLSLLIS